MSQCYICEEKATMLCNECNSKICDEHYKFHGMKCIVYTGTKISRTNI